MPFFLQTWVSGGRVGRMARSQWVPPGKASTLLQSWRKWSEEAGNLEGFICCPRFLKEAIELHENFKQCYLIWKLSNVLESLRSRLTVMFPKCGIKWGKKRNHRRKYFAFFSLIYFSKPLTGTQYVPGSLLGAREWNAACALTWMGVGVYVVRAIMLYSPDGYSHSLFI